MSEGSGIPASDVGQDVQITNPESIRRKTKEVDLDQIIATTDGWVQLASGLSTPLKYDIQNEDSDVLDVELVEPGGTLDKDATFQLDGGQDWNEDWGGEVYVHAPSTDIVIEGYALGA